ncbi:MAG: helix-turn-helix domain-containing protein, partial [Thermodesulfobacteriota bacterium]
GMSSQALQILHGYHWPGNVRELENVLRRAAICMGIAETWIRPEHLPGLGLEQNPEPGHTELEDASPSGSWPRKTLPQLRREWEKNIIQKALQRTQGNRARAAELLGISLRSLYSKLSNKT